MCFYSGALAFYFCQWIKAWPRPVAVSTVLVGIACAAAFGIFVMNFTSLSQFPILGGIVFPLLILTLALLKIAAPDFGSRFGKIGDFTYALLLVHFPIQLLMARSNDLFALGIDFYTHVAFCTFVTISIITAVAVHLWVELPIQKYLRKRFSSGSQELTKHQGSVREVQVREISSASPARG